VPGQDRPLTAGRVEMPRVAAEHQREAAHLG
jgi:hypothetical protein